MRFPIKNATEFGWEGLKGWAHLSKDDFANASTAYFEVTGSHGKTKTTHSDRIYFVVDGKGEYTVGGETFTVEKHDVVIIQKNTPYDYKAIDGVMKLFLVHTPAYVPEAEVKL